MTRDALIGCEFELQLLPEQPERFLRDYPSLWEGIADAMPGRWELQRDVLSRIVTGFFAGEGSEKTCIANDSSKSLLEFALPPCESLAELHDLWRRYFPPVAEALRSRGIRILGVGMHPDIDIHAPGAYDAWVTPRGRYKLAGHRGWQHEWLLAPASTQPSLDVPVERAIEHVNFLERVLPLLQPLCANSNVRLWEADPEYAELRNTRCYPRLFERSIDAPAEVSGMPDEPYRDMGEYLRYLFSIPNYVVIPNTKERDLTTPGLVLLDPDRTGAPPSLEVLLTKLIEDRGRWEGHTLKGTPVSIGIEDIVPGEVARIDWYSYRPARLKYVLSDYTSWDDFWHDYRCAPERLLRKTFIEVRTVSTQFPGEEMLPCALVSGLVRRIEEVQRYLDELCDWSEMRAFHRTTADRYDAWSAEIGGRPYAEVARELVALARRELSPSEALLLEPLERRLQERESPAHVARRAIGRGREAFLEQVEYLSGA